MSLHKQIVLSGLLCLFSLITTKAQEPMSLPKLYPSYVEDFSDYNSFPSLCFEKAFWDDNGKLWLLPCPGVRHANGINLFQFDGYDFRKVGGDWEKISKGVNVVGFSRPNELCGYIGDAVSYEIFFFDTETDQLRIFNLKEAGEILSMSVTEEGSVFLVMYKKDLWYFYEWIDEKLVLQNKTEVPPGFEGSITFNEKNTFLNEKIYTVKYDKQNYIIYVDKNTGKKQYIYATDFPTANVMLDTTLVRWASDVLKGAGDDKIYLDHKGVKERLLYSFTPEDATFSQLKGIPNNWTMNLAAEDLSGNKLYQFYDETRRNRAILIDKDGQYFDYSPLFDHVKNILCQSAYSTDFKKEIFICHRRGILLEKIKSENAIQYLMPDFAIRAMTELPRQQFIIGTQSRGDYLLDLNSLTAEPLDLEGCYFQEPGLRTTFITSASGHIWTNVFNGIVQYDPRSDECVKYPWDESEPHCFAFIKPDELLVVDKEWKLYTYNLSTQRKDAFKADGEIVDFETYVQDIHYGINGFLWVATASHLWKVDIQNHMLYNLSETVSQLGNSFLCIEQGDDGRIWLGTSLGGLRIFDPSTNGVQVINSENGLGNNTIATIVKDDDGDRWLATYNGISIVSPEGKLIANISSNDGLKEKENNRFAKLKTRDGKLLIGTIKGLHLIDPQKVKSQFSEQQDLKIYPTSITYFDINEKESLQHRYGLNGLDAIQLPASRRQIEVTFALSNYLSPEMNQYAYQLEGLDQDWNYIGNQHFLKLTNLPPGKYNLLIKGGNAVGNWTQQPLSIPINAKEYFYKQGWFYFLLFFLILSIGGGIALIWIQQLRTQVKRATYKIQKDKEIIEQQAEKLLELDQAKSRFFTNISHEFRTPLTIISGMIGRLRANPSRWLDEGSQMIQRNSDNLLNLVNQILDLRKLESGKMNVSYIQDDIIPYLKYILKSFHSLAEGKQVRIHFLTEEKQLIMDYDPEKILRIVSNLLSNAIKFTPEQGDVYLIARKEKKQDSHHLIIQIKDNGIGIPDHKLPYIFDQFYQVDLSATNEKEGTGIGLALCKELVSLLEGSIKVESKVGEGSVFTMSIPIHNKATLKSAEEEPEPLAASTSVFSDSEEEAHFQELLDEDSTSLPTVLLIDDNKDILHYLVACLGDDYQVDTAKDGQEGIDKSIEIVPDVIVCDVMMPVKDGFEVVDILKNDERTSHIPIILLTAKADNESRISGLRRGADAYLTKPFNEEELMIRLANFANNRKKIQAHFQKGTPLSAEEAKEIRQEDEFLQKIRQTLEARIDEEDFGIIHICRAIGMSRAQLHRKIKALTGQSTSIFLRQVRLEKGKTLLETTDMNVSQTAYAVGFHDPNYFSRLYFETFGIRPKETRK